MPALIRSLPGWGVLRLRIFAALTIGAAAAISFDSIRHLAVVAGFGPLSILFPLTLDAVAAYGMDLWVRRSPAAKQAKWLALSAIAMSTVANVIDHWLTQRAILGAVLGAVPPGMLAALLTVAHRHSAGTADRTADQAFDYAARDQVWRSLPQAVRSRGPRPSFYVVPDRVLSLDRSAPLEGPAVGPLVRRSGQDEKPLRTVDPDQARVVPISPRKRTSAVRVAGTNRATTVVRGDEEIVSWIRSQAEPPTKRTVMSTHGVGSGRAIKLINRAKEA
jgi:hypothetical protein